ncbi:7332_t:CDS:2, partial [Funneliformis geosporum]
MGHQKIKNTADPNNVESSANAHSFTFIQLAEILYRTIVLTFKGKVIPLPYANHLIEAANNATNLIRPFIAIDWRMENGYPLVNAGRKKTQSSKFLIIPEQHYDAIKLLNSTFNLNTW